MFFGKHSIVIFICASSSLCYSQSNHQPDISNSLHLLRSQISMLELKLADSERRVLALERNLSEFGKYEVIAVTNGSVDTRLHKIETLLEKNR